MVFLPIVVLLRENYFFYAYKKPSSVEERISSLIVDCFYSKSSIYGYDEWTIEVYWTKENVAIHYYLFSYSLYNYSLIFSRLWKSVPTSG